MEFRNAIWNFGSGGNLYESDACECDAFYRYNLFPIEFGCDTLADSKSDATNARRMNIVDGFIAYLLRMFITFDVSMAIDTVDRLPNFEASTVDAIWCEREW